MYELKLQYGTVFKIDRPCVIRIERKKTSQPGRGNRTRKVVKFYTPHEYSKLTEANVKR